MYGGEHTGPDMPAIKIHGGDFGRARASVCLSICQGRLLSISRGLFRGRFRFVMSREVASVQIVDASNYKSTGGAANAAVTGAVLLGGAGGLAGLMLGGNKREVSFVCMLRDGRQFVATVDRRVFDAYFMRYIAMPTADQSTT